MESGLPQSDRESSAPDTVPAISSFKATQFPGGDGQNGIDDESQA